MAPRQFNEQTQQELNQMSEDEYLDYVIAKAIKYRNGEYPPHYPVPAVSHPKG